MGGDCEGPPGGETVKEHNWKVEASIPGHLASYRYRTARCTCGWRKNFSVGKSPKMSARAHIGAMAKYSVITAAPKEPTAVRVRTFPVHKVRRSSHAVVEVEHKTDTEPGKAGKIDPLLESTDRELLAMREIIKVLLPLNQKARERIVRYAVERWEQEQDQRTKT